MRRNNLYRGLVVSLNGRFKRTCELTSSIVPRGTSFHCWVDLEFSPIGFDPERFSCCWRGCLPGPPELGAVNPDAMHDHGQSTRQGHDRPLPRRLAICMAQALSQDHLFDCSMLCAAS